MAKKIIRRNNNFTNKVSEVCPLKGKESKIVYKNIQLLKKYISTRGRILPRAKTGVCVENQRRLTLAIKRARQVALLPYAQYV